MTLAPSARSRTPARHDRMPYRVFLAQIGERLRLTYEGRANGYESARQFRDDVRLIAASLAANKGANAGLFYIRRLLRRIDTFGFHLATSTCASTRACCTRSSRAATTIPGWPGRPAPSGAGCWRRCCEKDAGPRVDLDALGKRNLAVFEAFAQARHRYGPDAVGYFIVSGARGADDVLAALALARWASVYDKRTGQVALDIAPQFESLEALERCGETLRELLAEPVYRRHLEAHGGRQCVLLGYSDSNKEGGLCASRYAIHQAQRALARMPAAGGERYLVFHARGGSIARGGGRIDALVKSAPAGTIDGTLRVREQGETVKQGYGLRPIAMRTLERAFNALSLATVSTREAPGQGSRPAGDSAPHLECAATLAEASREAYRRLVYGDGEFHDYFRAVTPIDVIERMQVGSRPVHREEGRSIEGLLPVPWVFAWTQTRHMLPGWFGAGTGLAVAIERHGAERLRAAYADWFFLRTLIDDVEAMLARADLEIAAAYDVLVPQPLRRFSAQIRAEYDARAGASAVAEGLHRSARQRAHAAALDPAAQPLHRSDEPHAGGPAAALARRRARRPRSLRGTARERGRHRAGTAEHRLMTPTRGEEAEMGATISDTTGEPRGCAPRAAVHPRSRALRAAGAGGLGLGGLASPKRSSASAATPRWCWPARAAGPSASPSSSTTSRPSRAVRASTWRICSCARRHAAGASASSCSSHLARTAVERRCARLEWAVLDWNEPSIGFYRSLGAVPLDDWTVFRLTGEALTLLAGSVRAQR